MSKGLILIGSYARDRFLAGGLGWGGVPGHTEIKWAWQVGMDSGVRL